MTVGVQRQAEEQARLSRKRAKRATRPYPLHPPFPSDLFDHFLTTVSAAPSD